MARINSLDDESLRKIADQLRRGSYLPINSPRPQSLRDARSGPRVVRWAKTTTSDDFPTYPSAPANVYVVRFGTPSFEATPGWVDDMGWEDYSPAERRIAFDPAGRYWPEGSLVEVELHHGQWYFTGNARYHFIGKVDEYGIAGATENESGDLCPGSGSVALYQFDTVTECLVAVEVAGVQQTLTVRTLQTAAISADRYVILHETRDGIWWVETSAPNAFNVYVFHNHPYDGLNPHGNHMFRVKAGHTGQPAHPDFAIEYDGGDPYLVAQQDGWWAAWIDCIYIVNHSNAGYVTSHANWTVAKDTGTFQTTVGNTSVNTWEFYDPNTHYAGVDVRASQSFRGFRLDAGDRVGAYVYGYFSASNPMRGRMVLAIGDKIA